MPIPMAFWLNSMMGWFIRSSLAFSHILLIILKSEHLSLSSYCLSDSITSLRVLLACIKQLSKHPCPTCLVSKKNIQFLGTACDTHTHIQKRCTDDENYQYKMRIVRNYIYKSGGFLNSWQIKNLLGPESIVPTLVCKFSCRILWELIHLQSTFSDCLAPLHFDFFCMFAPDLLHEFELGAWKAIFKHLIRIMYTQGNDAIQKLNNQ